MAKTAVVEVYTKQKAQQTVEDIYRQLGGRLAVSALASCPVEFTAAFVNLTSTQSCGKCTPCRVGLRQLSNLLESVLDGKADISAIALVEELAEDIFYSADCAIGFEAAALALKAVKGFREDFQHHIELNTCGSGSIPSVPCVAGCPANVDVPAYLALTAAGRYTEALRVVRKDNPLAITCGLVCEHPCELFCRRGMVDDPINIRALKRYASDNADDSYEPVKHPPTGRRVAVVGGGPAGLTAAYYLALMGHSPVIFEQRAQLGGMLRYGIPAYRLPREQLDKEVGFLLGAGIEARLNSAVGSSDGTSDGSAADSADATTTTSSTGINGSSESLDSLRQQFDAVFVAIGAHQDKKLGIEGEDAQGVLSAVQLLREVGDSIMPDFKGQRVVVVGGGNVAMDVARTALRLDAKSVKVAYRRRAVDMTAQAEEIHAAIAEGCEILDLKAPVRVQAKDGKVTGLVVKPQIIGEVVNGRAVNKPASADELVLDADIILVAVGQASDTGYFVDAGMPAQRGLLQSDSQTAVAASPGLFVGGECVTGPATVIRAVSAGKAAARAIDSYLGYQHQISLKVDVPPATFNGRMYCARSNTTELQLGSLPAPFAQVEAGLLPEEALQEASRCLRCDHFGLGAFREGRQLSW